MDERDLIDELTGGDLRRAHATVFLSRVKTAGWRDAAKAPFKTVVQFVKENPKQVAGALIGGALTGAAQYRMNKTDSSGTSAEQRTTRLAEEMHQRSVRAARSRGEDPGFVSDLAGATTSGARGISDVLAKHPGKGALLAVPLGVSLGAKYLPKFMK